MISFFFSPISQLGRIANGELRCAPSATAPSAVRWISRVGTPEITTMLVSESKNSSLTKFLKLYDSTSSLRLKPMLRAVSLLRKFSAMPLVKCACTSMTKNSLFGYFSSIAASS